MADLRQLPQKNKRVRVFVRTRPTPYFAYDKLELLPDNKAVCVHCSRNEEQGYINNQVLDWNFKMDGVLHNTSQDDTFEVVGREAVTGAMEGYNATIMAYGQTGAGKTFTMTGDTSNYRLRGIIPRTIAQVFQEARNRQESSIKVSISYVEIYNEMMYDLLATLPDDHTPSTSNPLVIAEDNKGLVYVKGLSIRLAENEEEALNMLFEGETNRVIGAHSLNTNSSRSHCVFTIHIESRSRTKSSAQYTVSKINLVDLAGSERLNKTHSTGSTEREALYINKSLSFLEQVIIALADKRRDHIPYRQSKLTHLLKDSLGGNCHTLMIANIWGEVAQMEETISTLRFASRMMCVSNEPVQNVLQDPVLLVQQYERELDALRQELAMHDVLANRASVSYEPFTEGEKEDIQRQVRQYLDGTLTEIEIINVRQIKETFAQFKATIQNMEAEMEERLQSVAEMRQSTPVQSSSSGVPPTATTTVPRVSSKGNTKSRATNIVTQPSNEGDSELVGDTDGQGFGIGVAPLSVKQNVSPVVATKKIKSKQQKKTSYKPPEGLAVGGPLTSSGEISQHSLEQARASSRSGSPEMLGDKKDKPSTPPPPQEAFEEFKKTRGVNINQVLMESKEKLQTRKKSSIELSKSVNETKKQIDQLRTQVEEKSRKRLETTGDLVTDNGEVVMDEEEYTAIVELKKMKQQYRSLYDNLTSVKREIQFCQHKVDQSRRKMMEEFDSWYKQCYLGDTEQPSENIPQAVESNQELFDKVQAHLLNNDNNTQAFYHARTRTDKRLMASPAKRKPGTVTSNVKNKPPTLLTVS
ncbi:kinesin-like protein KIF9 isoform X2 [Dysidea avara]|uniref:kinesin-like protein KIF9 isoform X2 n=1 Tax=Dysidea avara TaxID=196820 RepID=UPI0033180FE9